MNKKRCTAIVLAAGSGRRMKSNVAKQYMLLQDKPLIWYALDTIEKSSVIDDCILVTGAEDIAYAKEEIVARYGFRKIDVVAAGGEAPKVYLAIHGEDGCCTFEEASKECHEIYCGVQAACSQ